MLTELRKATAVLHEQLEKENNAKLILNHTITPEQYKELLYQNYIAYYCTEKEISRQLQDYRESKYLALEKDLKALNIPAKVPASIAQKFSCNSEIEALGAAYVVEGSAMGGKIISKNLTECSKLSHIKNHYFFSGKREDIKSWRAFTKKLESRSFSDEEIRTAQSKARETFRFFSIAFMIQIPVF
ncbi:biliverdin-producing heme oxygenase [Zunongwangia sp. F363]|uniref:Biliverdin-producing heme oxygenase n=1 Tax=Autumnicola tepida TaxID=3075595 RepID=A0ABU3CEM7_9FLAO|nr:biliverdin-producing heme oxygenase [Zunongwangia sp. F363]MDT0644682.1 biliverdin-producing heme oxygenase [Zunongwangia sp. F363]